jgi:hypothetical protein
VKLVLLTVDPSSGALNVALTDVKRKEEVEEAIINKNKRDNAKEFLY